MRGCRHDGHGPGSDFDFRRSDDAGGWSLDARSGGLGGRQYRDDDHRRQWAVHTAGAALPGARRPTSTEGGRTGSAAFVDRNRGQRGVADRGRRSEPRLRREHHRRVSHCRGRGREGRPGRRHHARSDCLERLCGNRAGHSVARGIVQLSAADDHRRHRHRQARNAARPGTRSGAGADQRQAASSECARASERQHRPRLDRCGSERDSRLGDRSHRGAPRRGSCSVRFGRDRRRDQHRPQGWRVAAQPDHEVRAVARHVHRQSVCVERTELRGGRRH